MAYLLLMGSFFSFEYWNKNYLILSVGVGIITIHHLSPFGIPTMCIGVFFSSLNVHLISKISSPAHFSLILAGLLLGNYLGRNLPSLTLYPALAIFNFFPLLFLYRLDKRELATI